MNKVISVVQKRGCARDSLNLILVKANVNSVSKIFTEYFELKVYSKLAVDIKKNLLYDRVYLDNCLKYYDAYIATFEKTPLISSMN